MIISITGLIGSGKSTVADYLVSKHEFVEVSFAGTLKDAVSAVFGWDRELLEGKTVESREWREQIDQWWADKLNMPNLTPRLILQLWGTEVCRKCFHDDIWVTSLENKLKNLKSNIVISDCRFPNEFAALRNVNAAIVKVQRGADPDWISDALAENSGDELASTRLTDLGIHVSERAWIGANFDIVIDNNSTKEDLYKQVDNLLEVWN